MASKTILIITNRVPYPLNDGGNLAVHATIYGYQQAGWKVHVLSMNTSRHYITSELLNNIYADIGSFEAVDVNNDLSIVGTLKNFFFSRQPNHAGRFFKIGFLRKIEELIDRYNPDVIQFESVYMSSYIPYVNQLNSALLVLRMHNIEYQIWDRLAKETRNPFKRFYLKNLSGRIRNYEIKAWKAFDLLLPITQTDADIVRNESVETHLQVTPFGIKAKDIETRSNSDKWVGYHLGAMDWLPNLKALKWFLEDIWPIVHAAIPEFKFYFGGRNMPVQMINNDRDGVFCEGEVADANSFIADKKILIVPLKAGGGIRVKILEAMALGKIVISTDVGMQGIDAKPGIHYLAANTPNDFARAIKWSLEHKDDAQNIAANGVMLVKAAYDSTVIMQRLNDTIEQMLGKSR